MSSKEKIFVNDLYLYLLVANGILKAPINFNLRTSEFTEDIGNAVLALSYAVYSKFKSIFEKILPFFSTSPDAFHKYIIKCMLDDYDPVFFFSFVFKMSFVLELCIYCFRKGRHDMSKNGRDTVAYVFEAYMQDEFYSKGGWIGLKEYSKYLSSAYITLKTTVQKENACHASVFPNCAKASKFFEEGQGKNNPCSLKKNTDEFQKKYFKQIESASANYKTVGKFKGTHSRKELHQEANSSERFKIINDQVSITKEILSDVSFQSEMNEAASKQIAEMKIKFGDDIEFLKIPSFCCRYEIQYAVSSRLRPNNGSKMHDLTEAQKLFILVTVEYILHQETSKESQKMKNYSLEKHFNNGKDLKDVIIGQKNNINHLPCLCNVFNGLEYPVSSNESGKCFYKKKREKNRKKSRNLNYNLLNNSCLMCTTEANMEAKVTHSKSMTSATFYSADYCEKKISLISKVYFPQTEGSPFGTVIPKTRCESKTLRDEITKIFSTKQSSRSQVKTDIENSSIKNATENAEFERISYINFESLNTAVYVRYKDVINNAEKHDLNFRSQVIKHQKNEDEITKSSNSKSETKMSEELDDKNYIPQNLIWNSNNGISLSENVNSHNGVHESTNFVFFVENALNSANSSYKDETKNLRFENGIILNKNLNYEKELETNKETFYNNEVRINKDLYLEDEPSIYFCCEAQVNGNKNGDFIAGYFQSEDFYFESFEKKYTDYLNEA